MWWRACEDANVGVRTGDDFVVLEVHSRSGGTNSLEKLVEEHGKPPQTLTARTGESDLQFYFRAGALPSRRNLVQGIDLSATGGFVLAPPSVHQNGNLYRWVNGRGPHDVTIAALPDWLRDVVVRAPSSSTPSPTTIGEGGRNQYLASFTGKLRRRGFSGRALVRALPDENTHRCSPPLETAEVERIAKSIEQYKSGERHGSTPPNTVDSVLASTGAAALTNALKERPWGDSRGGKGLTVHQLCRAMSRFGVRSRSIRFGASTAKGFVADDFADAFARYLPDGSGTTAHQHQNGSIGSLSETAHEDCVPLSQNDESGRNPAGVPLVPVVTGVDDGNARPEWDVHDPNSPKTSNGQGNGKTRYDG
jgi:hypothetical protein